MIIIIMEINNKLLVCAVILHVREITRHQRKTVFHYQLQCPYVCLKMNLKMNPFHPDEILDNKYKIATLRIWVSASLDTTQGDNGYCTHLIEFSIQA